MFVVIEGIDGSGKTYSARKLVQLLREYGEEAMFTYEPYKAKQLNNYGLEHNLPQEYFLGLMVADRAYHVQTVIEPALQAGVHVICDRFVYSNIAYQGYGGLDIDTIVELNKIATRGLEPDIVFYLNIPPKRALKNIIERDGTPSMDLDFIERVANGYKQLAKQYNNWVIIDAVDNWDQKEDIMADYIIRALNKL